MIDRISTRIFADGADLDGILRLAADPRISGFTTNPTLMWKAGLTEYADFAERLLERITQASDLLRGVRRRRGGDPPPGAADRRPGARTSTSRSRSRRPSGESLAPLVRELSEDGVQVNVTALFTTAQVELITRAVADGAPSYISVFAGRIADAGVDPLPIMARVGRDHARRAALGAASGPARARCSTSCRPTRSAATSSR